MVQLLRFSLPARSSVTARGRTVHQPIASASAHTEATTAGSETRPSRVARGREAPSPTRPSSSAKYSAIAAQAALANTQEFMTLRRHRGSRIATSAVGHQSMLALEQPGGSSHTGSMLPCAQFFTDRTGLRGLSAELARRSGQLLVRGPELGPSAPRRWLLSLAS